MKAAQTGPTPNVSGHDALERMKDLTRRILTVPKPTVSKPKKRKR